MPHFNSFFSVPRSKCCIRFACTKCSTKSTSLFYDTKEKQPKFQCQTELALRSPPEVEKVFCEPAEEPLKLEPGAAAAVQPVPGAAAVQQQRSSSSAAAAAQQQQCSSSAAAATQQQQQCSRAGAEPLAGQERHLPLVSGLDGDAADARPPAPCHLLAF